MKERGKYNIDTLNANMEVFMNKEFKKRLQIQIHILQFFIEKKKIEFKVKFKGKKSCNKRRLKRK